MPRLLLCLALLAGLVACWPEEHELRYRVTVEVATPAGIRTGSGVIQVTATEQPFWAPGMSVTYHLEGEAVPVDLPGGRTLYALLGLPGLPDQGKHRPFDTFRSLIDRPEIRGEEGPPDRDSQFAFLKREKPSAPLEGNQRPFLVFFRDASDPASVQEIDPDRPWEALGDGYTTVDMTISITEDPVSRGIRKRLPWLSKYPEPRLVEYEKDRDFTPAGRATHGDLVRD